METENPSYKVPVFHGKIRVEGPRSRRATKTREKFMIRMECLGFASNLIDDLDANDRDLINSRYETFEAQEPVKWQRAKREAVRKVLGGREKATTTRTLSVSPPVPTTRPLSDEVVRTLKKAIKKLSLEPTPEYSIRYMSAEKKEKILKARKAQSSLRFLQRDEVAGVELMEYSDDELEAIITEAKAVNSERLKITEEDIFSTNQKGIDISKQIHNRKRLEIEGDLLGDSPLRAVDFLGAVKPQRVNNKKAYASTVAVERNPEVCPHPTKAVFANKNSAWDFISKNYSGDTMIHAYDCHCGAIHIGHAKDKKVYVGR